jgi:Alpha amylase, catalytic domain
MNHLDYIQSMGFDAVWISPISANLEGATSQGEAFHGCVRRPTSVLMYPLIVAQDTGQKILSL